VSTLNGKEGTKEKKLEEMGLTNEEVIHYLFATIIFH